MSTPIPTATLEYPRCPKCDSRLIVRRTYTGDETRELLAMTDLPNGGTIYVEIGELISDSYTEINSRVVACSHCDYALANPVEEQ